MPRFYIVAEVRREILDNVSLRVEADDLSDAYKKAKEALKDYPEKTNGNYIPYIYIDNRMYLSNEVTSLGEDTYYA